MIRELTRDELRQAAELKCQCELEDFKDILPENYVDVDKEHKFLNDWLYEKDVSDVRRAYGAFDGKDLMGYVGGSFAETEDAENGVEINFLFVKKEHRGKSLGLKLFKSILDEFRFYDLDTVVLYNWHESDSNRFYRALHGKVMKQLVQKPAGKEALVDVFSWKLGDLRNTLDNKLLTKPVEKETIKEKPDEEQI